MARSFLLALTIAAAACSTLPVGHTVEPHMIVVRNRSDVDIATVTLREAGGPAERSARYGSLSPVPAGVSQSYVRPTAAQSLPAVMIFEWTDNEGKTQSREVKTASALRSATGAAGEALVFEFGPFGDVSVFVEDTTRSVAAAVDPGKALEGGLWLLLELNGTAVQLPAGERQPYLLFQPRDGRVTGYSGCNEFTGNYEVRGGLVSFGVFGMTRRYCADRAGDVEQVFLGVLSKVRGWRVEQQTLLITDGDRTLARLRQEQRIIRQ